MASLADLTSRMVQRPGIQDVLLAFPAVERLGFHPDRFEELQNTIRKEEAQEV